MTTTIRPPRVNHINVVVEEVDAGYFHHNPARRRQDAIRHRTRRHLAGQGVHLAAPLCWELGVILECEA